MNAKVSKGVILNEIMQKVNTKDQRCQPNTKETYKRHRINDEMHFILVSVYKVHKQHI